MRFFSLRFRIALVFTAAYGALFVLLLLWMIDHTRTDFLAEEDEQLRRHCSKIFTDVIASNGQPRHDFRRLALDPASGKHLLRLTLDDSVLIESRIALPRIQSMKGDDRDTIVDFAIGHDRFRVLHSVRGRLGLTLGADVTVQKHILDETYVLLSISIPCAILLSFVLGYYLVRRLLRPIQTIAAKAEQLSSTNLNERIPNEATNDELGVLVRTLNRMIERLQEGFVRTEQFAANASHELRTPLTIMQSEIELALTQQGDDESYRRVLVSSLDETRTLARIVNNLFMLAKMDGKRMVLEREEVSISDLVSDVHEQALIIAAGRDLKVEFEKHSAALVMCDPVLIARLLLNLVENALKYTPDGGIVRIIMEVGDSALCVHIDDSGPGIPQFEQERIFERFVRVTSSGGQSIRGAGLGLPIARMIAEIHGGSLTVTSREGVGSRFTFSLPIHT